MEEEGGSFNPRARVGRDEKNIAGKQTMACFNPRARVGRDLPLIPFAQGWKSFNPRARVGRDLAGPEALSGLRSFNPRARVGRDAYMLVVSAAAIQFQSTRPRGARHSSTIATMAILFVSIHAPAWGATTQY